MKTNALQIEFSFGVDWTGIQTLNTLAQIQKGTKSIKRMATELFGGWTWTPMKNSFQRGAVLTVVTSERDVKMVRQAIAMLADVIKGSLAQTSVEISVSQIQHYKY